jgi:signal transduction histidine kinase
MFEPFTQADTMATRRAGLGLGLAIARQLVELHGGTIQARNREDSTGAEFAVLLPGAWSGAESAKLAQNGVDAGAGYARSNLRT